MLSKEICQLDGSAKPLMVPFPDFQKIIKKCKFIFEYLTGISQLFYSLNGVGLLRSVTTSRNYYHFNICHSTTSLIQATNQCTSKHLNVETKLLFVFLQIRKIGKFFETIFTLSCNYQCRVFDGHVFVYLSSFHQSCAVMTTA